MRDTSLRLLRKLSRPGAVCHPGAATCCAHVTDRAGTGEGAGLAARLSHFGAM